MRTFHSVGDCALSSRSRGFRALYDRTFRAIAAKKYSLNHLRSYDQAVAAFVSFAGDPDVDAIDEEQLVAFNASLVAAGRASKQSRALAGLVRQIALEFNPKGLRVSRQRVDPLPCPRRGTVRHYFETVYVAEAMVGMRESSIENTRLTLRELRHFLGHDLLFTEQNDSLAANFFRWLLQRGLTGQTVNRYRRTWFAVWRHASDRGLVKRAPRVKRLKEVRNPPDSWTLEELRKLIDAAGNFRRTDLYGDVRCNLWWRAIFLVAYYTGLRKGSLLGIRRDDFDLKTRLLYVPGENMKNRQGQMFQLGAEATAAIADIWMPQRILLFPTQHTAGTISKHFAALLVAADVAPGRRKNLSKFHKLRRTVATEIAARAGCAAASGLLGHSSSYVTARYIDPTKLPGHDVTKILPPMAAG